MMTPSAHSYTDAPTYSPPMGELVHGATGPGAETMVEVDYCDNEHAGPRQVHVVLREDNGQEHVLYLRNADVHQLVHELREAAGRAVPPTVEVLQVRMGMSMQTAERLADVLLQLGPDQAEVEHRILDQLWLRSSLIEQRRRMRVSEREAFDVRADRMLADLDPTEDLATASQAARMLDEFHRHPNALAENTNTQALRRTLHQEEHEELMEELDRAAAGAGYLPQIARELADVVYVAYGTAWAYGIDLDAAIREVHRAAMDKMRAGLRRADGKILKPPGFVPPDMSTAIRNAQLEHREENAA